MIACCFSCDVVDGEFVMTAAIDDKIRETDNIPVFVFNNEDEGGFIPGNESDGVVCQ